MFFKAYNSLSFKLWIQVYL